MDGSDDNEDNIMGLFGEDPRTEEPSGGGRNTNNVFGGRTAPAEVLAQPQRSFFRRSNSMSFVAGSESDPFEVSSQYQHVLRHLLCHLYHVFNLCGV